MKGQRYRFRLVALLLVALIALAGAYGVQMIPFSEADTPSLRDAILRLTGRATAAPPAEDASISPGMTVSPEISASPDGSASPPPEVSPGSEPSHPVASGDPSLPNPGPASEGTFPSGQGTALEGTAPADQGTATTALISPDPSPASLSPLSEALSQYFDSRTEEPTETPAPTPTPNIFGL